MDPGLSSQWGYSVMALSDGNTDRFDEHDGPVRGVHFHKAHPCLCLEVSESA